VGWRRVVREPGQVRFAQAGMGIDVGGIGKEYAVDRVTEMALALGIRNVLVDFGHDVRAHGSPPEGGVWRVGLEDPCDPGRCWGGVALQERAIATSGNYLRFREYGGERFGHLIDPRTGYPAATDCGAVSVVAPTCTEAGVLASCAVIMGSVAAPQWMASFNQATGALVTHRGVVRLPGFETIELGQKHASASGKE